MSWINKGKLFSLLVISLAGVMLCGAEKKIPTPDLSRSEAARNLQMSKLREQREKLLLTMHHTRIRLIRKDPRLLALQREILRRSRELALELNVTKEMSKLNDELAALERAIDKLANEKK